MRLLICAGGTGGGVYPALAVLQELGNEANPVLWVGSQDGMETGLIERAGIPYASIPAAGLHGVNWRSLPGNSLKNLRGIFASLRIMRQFKPELVFLTSGYVTAPMALAARFNHTPTLLFSPDIEPGKAISLASRMTSCTAVPVSEAKKYYSARTITSVTGYPIRSEIKNWNRYNSCIRLGLELHEPVLLFLGGSKGARSINRAVLTVLSKLLEDFQIVHITGTNDWHEVEDAHSNLSPTQRNRYHIFPYLHEDIGAALASADLVISRAGASILGEYPYFGLPAILVPYPHAWRYQKVNAAYLENKGAAVIIADEELRTQLLAHIYRITNDPSKLEAMRRAMSELQPKPPAAKRLADLARQVTSQDSNSHQVINDDLAHGEGR